MEKKFNYSILYCPFNQKVFCKFAQPPFETCKEAEEFCKKIMKVYPGTGFIIMVEIDESK